MLQKNKWDGGAGLVNLRIKDDSLKTAWLSIISTDVMIEKFAYMALNDTMKSDIWKCNIAIKDVKATFRDSFWRDVLIAWAKYNHEKPTDRTSIMNQIVWYNSYLKVNEKLIFIKKAYVSGLNTIAQLVTPEGKFLPIDIISRMFELTIMECNSIIAAIPKYWKAILVKDNVERKFEYKYEHMLKVKKVASFYYKIVNKSNEVKNVLQNRWAKSSIGLVIENEDLQKHINSINLLTNQAKLRSFQFRLLPRAIVMNDRLFRWKIVKSNKCTMCGEEKETIEHYFWFCTKAQHFWTKVKDLVQRKIRDTYYFDIENILFNTVHKKSNHIANVIVLIAKQYMYAAKCSKKEYNVIELERKIKQIQRYELYNAVANQKVEKHCEKWYTKEYNGSNLEERYINQYINQMQEY